MEENEKATITAAHNNNTKIINSSDIIKPNEEKMKKVEDFMNEENCKPIDYDTDEHLIDLSKNYPQPKYSLFQAVIGAMPRGDIQAIKAKSKNGKSFLCTVLIASLLGCSDFGFRNDVDHPKVIYFDTEQNERNTANIGRRVHYLLSWDATQNNPGFMVYNLRTLSPDERLDYIQDIINRERPTNVFIDGVADLIENFNDIEQSNDVINILMRLSANYDCSISCVLHTNKSKDDNGMKGHLGTILLQKASDVFEVVRNAETFNVSVTDCRNCPINDFAFTLNEDAIPQPANIAPEMKGVEKQEEIKRILRLCFKHKFELSYTDLITAYNMNAGVSPATAKRRVTEAKKYGFIEVSNGRYRLSLKEA